ncbi:MAG TPA: hypothetical protein VFH80_13180 [Solirubrobacteraceae bacterium]|nr:hypothetical protein [Solirubrobacteraceae bacterium]
MTHHTTPEADAGPGNAHQHSARAHALDEAVLDHHKEELLAVLGDLDQPPPGGPVARVARET